MGVTWTYFKQFEIVEHEENDFDEMIRYSDQGELKFTYTTSGTLRAVFGNYGIHIGCFCPSPRKIKTKMKNKQKI
ncbi:hypothetical protein PDR35_32110 [Bacillus cereus]|nr:hypothetical protein [Bacillus cereus]